jgi:hypothetical protein
LENKQIGFPQQAQAEAATMPLNIRLFNHRDLIL